MCENKDFIIISASISFSFLHGEELVSWLYQQPLLLAAASPLIHALTSLCTEICFNDSGRYLCKVVLGSVGAVFSSWYLVHISSVASIIRTSIVVYDVCRLTWLSLPRVSLWTCMFSHVSLQGYPLSKYVIKSIVELMVSYWIWIYIYFFFDPQERLPSGHTLPWRAWRTSNRVRSGQAATPAAKHLWGYRDSKNCMFGAATCDLNHIMTSCTHLGERPSLDDIAEMKDGYVRWLRAIADTIWWLNMFFYICKLRYPFVTVLSMYRVDRG